MRLCSKFCADIAFKVARISERPNKGKWFIAIIKLLKRLCMMLVLVVIGQESNRIYKVNYVTYAYWIEFWILNVFKNK